MVKNHCFKILISKFLAWIVGWIHRNGAWYCSVWWTVQTSGVCKAGTEWTRVGCKSISLKASIKYQSKWNPCKKLAAGMCRLVILLCSNISTIVVHYYLSVYILRLLCIEQCFPKRRSVAWVEKIGENRKDCFFKVLKFQYFFHSSVVANFILKFDNTRNNMNICSSLCR